MNIKKSTLKRIILEELEAVISERSVPTELISNAHKLVQQISRRTGEAPESTCVDFVNRKAKLRGWDLNALTPEQSDAYEKLYNFCKRRRSKKYRQHMRQTKKMRRKITSPYKHAVSTVRGGRTKRALSALGV